MYDVIDRLVDLIYKYMYYIILLSLANNLNSLPLPLPLPFCLRPGYLFKDRYIQMITSPRKNARPSLLP